MLNKPPLSEPAQRKPGGTGDTVLWRVSILPQPPPTTILQPSQAEGLRRKPSIFASTCFVFTRICFNRSLPICFCLFVCFSKVRDKELHSIQRQAYSVGEYLLVWLRYKAGPS